ncbi:hypothetical protein D5S17_02565 [Pseudonocardiaceae bacterium YIM PH 21723]|nr:hypothetical protein D5S17_02565 [Pseudonocardiaceae bacterium YIM PH 21723]
MMAVPTLAAGRGFELPGKTAIALAAALAALFLFGVLFDQGELLTPILGKVASSANYLHEFMHDGRHLLGAPCH